jgi:hypothetical protein
LPWKQLFIHPKRVYHNGLVKRPSSVREAERLGQTLTADCTTIMTELENDLLRVDDAKMNEPFLGWKVARSLPGARANRVPPARQGR